MSHIIKHIYNYGSDEVIRRGKKIFLTGGVKLIRKEELSNQLIFRVRNDQYYNQYQVTVSKYQQAATLQARCQCPYNMGEICRHEAAALFYLNELIQNQSLDTTPASFNQYNTLIRMRSIELKSLRLFTSGALFEEAERMSKQHKMVVERAENEIVEASIQEGDDTFHVILKRNDDQTYNTSCPCSEQRHPLCKHKAALFLHLLNQYGENYFDTIRNWNNQKNKLLSLYGYTLSDDLTGKFEFYYLEGKPFLKVLDPSIKKVNASAPPARPHAEEAPKVTTGQYHKRLGVVINLNETELPYFQIDLIEGELAEKGFVFAGTVNKIDVSRFVDPEPYAPEDRDLIAQVRRLQRSELDKYIAKNSPFGDLWENITHKDSWTDDTIALLFEYLHPKLLKLLYSVGEKNPLYILPAGKPYRTAGLKSVQFVHHSVFPLLHVRKEKEDIRIDVTIQIDDKIFRPEDNEMPGTILFLKEKKLYMLAKPEDANHLLELKKNETVPMEKWESFLKNRFLDLSKFYETHFGDDLVEEQNHIEPECSIQLSEQHSYFILKPMFTYCGQQVAYSQDTAITGYDGGKVTIIQRNKATENAFMNYVQQFHAQMRKPEFEEHFALHSKYALKNNWFFEFFDRVKEDKIPVYGYEMLRQFRINKSKPNTKVSISSNLDWFDTEIQIDFGGQQAKLSEIQTALATKQNYIPLDDGTYGLLPEEWLQKFSLLFKMADSHGSKLRVSKYNFTVMDELEDLITEENVKAELNEKKQNLLKENYEDVYQIPVPSELQATLRPYQETGFQWLVYLNKVKWGGLLADDMGLGKTIQALTFLQYLKNEQSHLTALVVCPTTLIYNWEKEIQKFTPKLTYIVHHGPTRTNKIELLKEHDVIISSYGTLRSDVDMLSRILFDYVVLDESQTIKNPVSKIAKAAQSLITHNRLALSGTPMQNNTFDMYSQMNFLNPGMLGAKEFFKEQFAKPIDKFQEVDTKQHLRKLIYPFLLRRTKEQVAKDLPEKTEITLYCEMGEEQRNVYELYRNRYRSQILGTIDEQGIERSQFAILQGLMKLRQICDSPAILKEEVKLPNHSAKLDELTRELTENMGDHKALIFSQFLGMLDLIKQKLKENDIPFQYFDGSYTALQREAAIKQFQEDENCRVFLISLKAGGMGLNLTSADYVYLVDPWWNPAVEQQAIDRTHRIGQTKNIFAYRLICKDTVEEKIMILKERKNSLVKDIVADDNTMIKQLSKEDVQYLFS